VTNFQTIQAIAQICIGYTILTSDIKPRTVKLSFYLILTVAGAFDMLVPAILQIIDFLQGMFYGFN
jgi:hypothetical protein